MFERHPRNPLITPASIQPSRADLEIIGTFNAGAVIHENEILLVVRVAERPADRQPDVVLCPYLNEASSIVVKAIKRDDPAYNTSDPRVVRHLPTGEVYLTSISHFRLARSSDGVNFTFDPGPWINPVQIFEGFGIEDARITRIDDTYYVNYTAVSRYGIATSLMSTPDFRNIDWHEVIFPPSNRDVVIFPQRINGLFACYHRPMPGDLGGYNMWLATSPDLIHWGGHQVVLEAGTEGWEAGRVGGGAPPIWTERGWLSIYHAADRRNRYCLGAFLTPHDEPQHILTRSAAPILEPEADYEVEGFFGNVVFTCGAVLDGETLRLYYGAADETIGLAEAPLSSVLDALA